MVVYGCKKEMQESAHSNKLPPLILPRLIQYTTFRKHNMQQKQEKARILVVSLCGLPAAGKSQVAASLCDLIHASTSCGMKCTHVRFDDYEHLAIADAGGTFDPANWHAARQHAFAAVREAAKGNDEHSVIILVDDVLHLSGMRRHVLRVAESVGAAHAQLCITCDASVRHDRNQKRSGLHRVPDETLSRLEASWEDPTTTTFAFDRKTVRLDTTEAQADDVAAQAWSELQSRWGGAAIHPDELARRRVLAGQASNAKSFAHQADVTTRAMLGAAVQRVDSRLRGEVARHLNEVRRRVLESANRVYSVCCPDADEAWAVALSFADECDEQTKRRLQPGEGEPDTQ